MTPSRAQRGFTLIELTLVLFILALSAHLAVRELSRQRARRLHGEASRRLEAIASAVYAEDAHGTPSGFLADMGRLPEAQPPADADASSPLTLRELWECPDGIGDYRARPATAANLADGAPDALVDPDVLVPCGWGGPYLRLPPGTDRLLDPWGNPMETPDAIGLSRLFADTDATTPADASDTPVAAIRHYGSDGLDDGEFPPENPDQAAATVSFVTPTSRLLLAFEPGTVAEIRCYAPCGDKITGIVKNPLPDDTQALLEDLPPGIRVLKIIRSEDSPRVHHVTLHPGRDTLLDL